MPDAQSLPNRSDRNESNLAHLHARRQAEKDHTPTRGISAYMDLEARIERQITEWEAEAREIPIAPTDKVQTLLRYARDEIRDHDRQRTQEVVMRP